MNYHPGLAGAMLAELKHRMYEEKYEYDEKGASNSILGHLWAMPLFIYPVILWY